MHKDPWDLKYRGDVHPDEAKGHSIHKRSGFVNPVTGHWFVNYMDHPYNEPKRFDWIRGYHVGGRSIMWGRQSYRWSEMDFEENRDPLIEAVQDWINNTEVGDLKRLSERESKVLWEELETVFSRDRLWGGGVREEVWTKVVEGDVCVREAKTAGENFKQCKTSRNVQITLALPKELRVRFEQLISPSRPAVLHFGIHNRMDCNVCKPN